MGKPEEFFAQYLKEKDEERDRIVKETFFKTRSLEAVNEALRSRRGGARHGAGRKPGRVVCDRLQFNVTAEVRKLFEELAEREGLSQVKFLQKILFAYRDNLREKGELE